MTAPFLNTESGEEVVMLSRREHAAVPGRLGDEDAEDRMTILLAAEAQAETPLPESVSAAVLGGESLLRALRNWRSLT